MPPFQPGAALGQAVDYLDLMGLKTNENEPDHSSLFHFLDVLNNEPDESFPAEIEKVLDVDGALRFFAVSTLIVHLDNYLGSGHNYYLYQFDGRFTILPWDLNEAFGTFDCGIDRDGLINFYIDEPTAGQLGNRPLVKRLLSHPSYLETYRGYLNSLLGASFEVEVMERRIDQLADLIRPYVESDERKFFSTAEFERGLSDDASDADLRGSSSVLGIPTSAIGLKTFVKERGESVRQQLDGISPSVSDGSGNGAGGFMCGGL
jgi:spore coat protein CotH